MRLFELLKQEQKNKRLSDSDEYAFFIANRHLLIDHNCFLDLYSLEDDFSLIKANIVIKSLQNKLAIEAQLQELGQASLAKHQRIRHHDIRQAILAKHLDLPYLIDNETKMYVPIFNRAMNFVYTNEPDKLFDFPYDKLTKDFTASVINPFETYNFMLFDSYFTKLIKLGSDRTSMAFYHLDFRNILLINAQGGLDVKIALFDRHLANPDYEGIIDRVLPVVAAYFSNNRDLLVTELLNKKLVSQTLIDKWTQAIIKDERKKYKL